MILDNSEDRKVHEWIEKYIEQGVIEIVTGYFTIATLAYISQKINLLMRCWLPEGLDKPGEHLFAAVLLPLKIRYAAPI